MSVSWAVTPQKIHVAIEKIVETSRPLKIILFGSYVRGNMHLNSDLDVMVVMEDEVKSPRKESVRIRRSLKGILMPMDIIVVSESILDEVADTPGMIYREAIRNGEVAYESKR
ncbi:MAG: nucleotidyltransferase domain-containing protein [bacterium]|nr:nucleotidyltransferase domain-containing protein [bacterium]